MLFSVALHEDTMLLVSCRWSLPRRSLNDCSRTARRFCVEGNERRHRVSPVDSKTSHTPASRTLC
jgi:hypothetical protein